MISNPTVKDMARQLIQNYAADAPFYVEILHRTDLRITEYELQKDINGACFLSVRVEDK